MENSLNLAISRNNKLEKNLTVSANNLHSEKKNSSESFKLTFVFKKRRQEMASRSNKIQNNFTRLVLNPKNQNV